MEGSSHRSFFVHLLHLCVSVSVSVSVVAPYSGDCDSGEVDKKGNMKNDKHDQAKKRILANGWSKDSASISVCERSSGLDLDAI